MKTDTAGCREDPQGADRCLATVEPQGVPGSGVLPDTSMEASGGGSCGPPGPPTGTGTGTIAFGTASATPSRPRLQDLLACSDDESGDVPGDAASSGDDVALGPRTQGRADFPEVDDSRL